MKSNKSIFFCEIAFLTALNFFPTSEIDFWPFLKLQKMKFGQKLFHEITFLAVLNVFPSSKIEFWSFLKLQKMKFGQKTFFVKSIYLISQVFWAWTFLNFLAHCASYVGVNCWQQQKIFEFWHVMHI